MTPVDDSDFLYSMLEDIRIQHKELIEDTKKAHKKNDKLLLKLDAAADNVRELSIQNAELRKDVQFFRDASMLRNLGTLFLTLESLSSVFLIEKIGFVYYVIVVGSVVMVACGIWMDRRR